VTALDLLARGRRSLRDVEAFEEDGQPLARLNVRLGGVKLGERGVAD
jgi:hypothetical protein